MTFSSSRSVRDFARFAGRDLPRGAVGGRLEARVALAPFAAVGGDDLFAGRGQVLEQMPVLGVEDDRAGRNGEDQVFGRRAVAVVAAAAVAAVGLPLLAMGQRGEAIDAFLGQEDDAAAVAAVAAVGPAARNVLLPAEAEAAVAAAARLHWISTSSMNMAR